MSSRWVTNTLDRPERNAATMARLQQLKQQLRVSLAAQWLKEVENLAAELEAAQAEVAQPAAAVEPSAPVGAAGTGCTNWYEPEIGAAAAKRSARSQATRFAIPPPIEKPVTWIRRRSIVLVTAALVVLGVASILIG